MADPDVNLHQYAEGIHLEVISDTGDGNVSVVSVEFDRQDEVLSARSELPAEYEECIRSYIAEQGFTLGKGQ